MINSDLPRFPIASSNHFIMSNAFLRTALFSATRKERALRRKTKIGSQEGIDFYYQGEDLLQFDLDVYLSVIDKLTELNGEFRIFIRDSELMRGMGLEIKLSGEMEGDIEKSLDRMISCAVIIDNKKYRYSGNLIAKTLRDPESKIRMIEVNSDIALLFKNGGFSHIDKRIRHQLKGKPLAQWLHAFYSTHHKEVYPIGLEKLKSMSGSQSELKEFKRGVAKAMSHIASAHQKFNMPFYYEIVNNVLKVHRKRQELDLIDLDA